MRPKSIVWFERFFLSSALIGFLNVFLNYGSLRAYSVARGGAPATSLLFGAISLSVSLLVWLLIARRAQVWMKWVLIIMAPIGLLGIIPAMAAGAYGGLSPFYLSISAVAELMHLTALSFLFRADARTWFANKGRPSPTDAAIFD